MKNRKQRPWLSPSGVAKSTSELKKACRTWDSKTWEDYLAWYQGRRREALVSPSIYTKRGEELTGSIFEGFGQSCSSKTQRLAEQLLRSLPAKDAEVLRLIFFEGRTQREIGAIVRRSQSRVFQIKNSAILGISGLKRNFARGARI